MAADAGGVRRVGAWRVARAPAKINLGLRVVGRRADGYHLLDSLVVFAGYGDHVAARSADGAPSLQLKGPGAAVLKADDDNLVVQAARRFREAFGGPDWEIRLWKRLPVAAGVGGGSADAAALLRILADAAEICLTDRRLLDVALALGADTPMCLAGRAARVGGIGECLAAAPTLPPLAATLVNVGEPVSTPAAFARRSGPFSEPGVLAPAYRDLDALSAALQAFGNDLTAPAMTLSPGVAKALDRLAGAPFSGMSGSGGTCFGLFPTLADAQALAAEIRRREPGWFVAATRLDRAG